MAPTPTVYLERARLPLVAKVWHAAWESGEGAPPYVNSNLKKRLQLQKAGRAVYWRKQKGHASRLPTAADGSQ
jgi:hypothetical protein